MGISLKGEHLKRYKDIAALFMKYGRSELVKNAGLEEAVGRRSRWSRRRRRSSPSISPPTSRRWGRPSSSSASSCPRGPTSFPSPTWKRWPVSRTRWGRSRSWRWRPSSAPSWASGSRRPSPSSSQEPVAAASLGQVHRAALRDGRRVAVKVQRPGIREVIVKDLEALAEIAAFVDHAHGDRPPLRLRDHARGVPQDADARARLPPGGAQPGDPGREPARLRPHRGAAARRRLHARRACSPSTTSAARRSPSSARSCARRSTARSWPSSSSAPTCSRSWWTASCTPIPTPATSS